MVEKKVLENLRDSEGDEIHNLVADQKKEEFTNESYDPRWDEELSDDPSAIQLYSSQVIGYFSVIFGVIFGAVLQVYNYFTLKNYKGLFVTLLFGIVYMIFQFYIMDSVESKGVAKSALRILLSVFGAAGLFVIREFLFKYGKQYRAKSFILPLIITVGIVTLILLGNIL